MRHTPYPYIMCYLGLNNANVLFWRSADNYRTRCCRLMCIHGWAIYTSSHVFLQICWFKTDETTDDCFAVYSVLLLLLIIILKHILWKHCIMEIFIMICTVSQPSCIISSNNYSHYLQITYTLWKQSQKFLIILIFCITACNKIRTWEAIFLSLQTKNL